MHLLTFASTNILMSPKVAAQVEEQRHIADFPRRGLTVVERNSKFYFVKKTTNTVISINFYLLVTFVIREDYSVILFV